MIIFFRRLREKLLSQNKFSKYLLYAIGEILLVVIGILIALGVNNWNIEIDNKATEKQYITRLIEELDDEINNYNNLKEDFNYQRHSVIALLEIFNEPNPVIKDTASFWRNFSFISRAGPWYNKPVTWTQLVQSGELKLITNENVVTTLFKHYSNLEQTASNFSEYPTQTTSEARKFTATTFSETNSLFSSKNYRPFQGNTAFMQKIFEKKNEFKSLCVRVAVIAGFLESQMEDLIQSAENAKSILGQYLKN
ncbi:MAG: hypothetical protein HKO80_00750 [Flavobacteriaceae bacterium]|nr:hypothetical protein [Flavobacteriaceae bacterium]NNL31710.1 hypothetical protein [Flavobacteriaceae bacterium]